VGERYASTANAPTVEGHGIHSAARPAHALRSRRGAMLRRAFLESAPRSTPLRHLLRSGT
jgi:hypothetical protein